MAGGRFSKSIPVRMQAAYDESRESRAAANLMDDVNLLNARMVDLLERVDRGESGELWGSLVAACNELTDARYRLSFATTPQAQDKLTAQIEGLISRICGIAKAGQDDYKAWSEVLRVHEVKAKAIVVEGDRLVKAGQMITLDQLAMMFGKVMGIITRNVNQVQLTAIAGEMKALTVNSNLVSEGLDLTKALEGEVI